MGRHRFHRSTPALAVTAGVIVAVTGLAFSTVYLARPADKRQATLVTECARTVRVLASSSFAPVLTAVAPGLSGGPDCVRLEVDTADGRAAAERLNDADVWIPDDAAWSGTVAGPALAPKGTVGSGTVLATSPIFMVTDHPTAERLRREGGSWLALARLLTADSSVGLVVRDPAGSGDGLIAAGSLAESVWLDKGMDASALALSRALRVTRTVSGSSPALPGKPGEVGLVPEYALIAAADRLGAGVAVVGGRDHTATLRFTWLPTAAAAADHVRGTALRRLLSALTGEAAVPGLRAAGLRPAEGAVPSSASPVTGAVAARMPALTAEAFGVLEPHHIDHVFATWYPRDRQMNLLIVTDVSGSMATPAPGTSTPLIDLVRQGSRSVSDLLPADARLGVWEFGAELDGPRDYRVLVPTAPLTDAHRGELASALGVMTARETGTGLYDTVLAAYRAARDNYQLGVPNQVLLFTDGRNEDDATTITSAQLAEQLAAAKDPARPVQLTLVTFGQLPDAGTLAEAVKPVDGYVERLNSAEEVSAAFIHVSAGGLHSP